MKKNCRVWKREQNKENQKKEENKNTIATVTRGDENVTVLVNECLHIGDQMIKWVVDIVASYHATPNRELFTTYKAGDFGYVEMGNTASFNIVGIGDNLHTNQRRLPVEAARCEACSRFTPQLDVWNCLG